MIRFASLVAIMIATPAIAQDRRAVDVEAVSDRTTADIQTCIARRWGAGMDADVIGANVDVRYVGPFSRSNALTFTVTDLGEQRRITISYQRPWSASGAAKWFRKAEKCW